MQAYRARYERGRIVPLDTVDIPEGAQMIITVLDETPETVSRRNREAWREFFDAVRACDEEVPEFERVKFTREVDL